MKLVTGTTYHDELVLAFGALAPETLAQVLCDGRPSSCLLHAHLLTKHSNLHRPPPQVTSADCVVNEEGQMFQVRVVTKHGVTLLPAKNVGVRREYDADSYREILTSLAGFILIDVTTMPCITYGIVLKNTLPFRAKFTRADALTFLRLSEVR